MPRTAQVKLSPPKDRHCCLAFFPYDLVLSVPALSSPVQWLPAGLSPAYKYLMLHVHEATLPNTLFEEMILSEEVSSLFISPNQWLTFVSQGPSEMSPPILECIQTWRACLDRKQDLVTLLAKVQGKLEDCEGDICTVLWEKKITIYHDTYYYWENFVGNSTDIAKFKKDVSVINFKPFGCIYGWKKAV